MQQEGPESLVAQQVALALNLAFNDNGVYGIYADLASARLNKGPFQGSTPAQMSVTGAALSEQFKEWLPRVNAGFNGCPTDYYTVDSTDLDGDGIPAAVDCDDLAVNIGLNLYDDTLDSDSGYFQTTPQLDGDWTWDGSSVYATEGGQQALLGNAESWDDVVVTSTVAAKGTQVSCGFDCMESCGEYVPVDGCYSDWQALGLGILSAQVTGSGVLTFTNIGDYDICFDGFLMWDNAGSQGATVGDEAVDDADYRVPAGGSLELYYGSWTTANGYTQTYLDEGAFCCYQHGSYLTNGAVFTSDGALLPERLQEIIAQDTDLDGDGVEDHVDYVSYSGVQTQYNIWD